MLKTFSLWGSGKPLTLEGAVSILAKLKRTAYYSPAEYRRKYGTTAFRRGGSLSGMPKPVQRYYLIEALTKAIGEATQQMGTMQAPPSSMVGSTTGAEKQIAKAGCLIREVFT